MPPGSSDDKPTKPPHTWSPEDKLAVVLEAAAVPEAELGAFFRPAARAAGEHPDLRPGVSRGRSARAVLHPAADRAPHASSSPSRTASPGVAGVYTTMCRSASPWTAKVV